MLEKRYQEALSELEKMRGSRRISKGYVVQQISSKSFIRKLIVHRFIASKVFGVELDTRYKVVHHLDGNALNNHYTNLMIMTLEDHSTLHHFLSKHPEYYGLTQCETISLLKYIKDYNDFLNGNIVHDICIYLDRIDKMSKHPEEHYHLKDIKSILSKLRRRRAREMSSEIGKTKKTKKPDYDTLVDLIKKHDGRIKNIAFELGFTPSTVSKWYIESGINRKDYIPGYNSTNEIGKCPVCGKTFKKRHGEQQIYCSRECATRRITSDIDEFEACALYYIFKKSFREIGRIFDRDHEVMSRLIRRSEKQWLELDTDKRLEVIERVSEKYIK